jgi:hypothetical protein
MQGIVLSPTSRHFDSLFPRSVERLSDKNGDITTSPSNIWSSRLLLTYRLWYESNRRAAITRDARLRFHRRCRTLHLHLMRIYKSHGSSCAYIYGTKQRSVESVILSSHSSSQKHTVQKHEVTRQLPSSNFTNHEPDHTITDSTYIRYVISHPLFKSSTFNIPSQSKFLFLILPPAGRDEQ